jgi:hypothetical protein
VLPWRGPWTSSSLKSFIVEDSGLRTLLLELAVVGTLHALESEVLEALLTLSLTSGTSNFPSAPGMSSDRSRFWLEGAVVGKSGDVGDKGE